MLKHFWSRNVVMSDSPHMKAESSSFLAKIRDFCSWNVHAVLTQEQVKEWYYWTTNGITRLDKAKVRAQANILVKEQTFPDSVSDLFLHQRFFVSEQCREDNRFSFISQKNEIISQDIQDMLQEIEKTWEIITLQFGKTLPYYLSEWYVTIEIIEVSLMKYFQQRILDIYTLVNTPVEKTQNWKKEKVSEYHDINRDLGTTQKEMLAYGMKRWFLDDEKFLRIVQVLKLSGGNLEYFYHETCKANLFNVYLQSILNSWKKSL